MENYSEIEGDLIVFAKQGMFDVITHGCNVFCTMGAGIAPQMAAAFGADKFKMEHYLRKGDINKLGQIDYQIVWIDKDKVVNWSGVGKELIVVNSYTQFHYGKNHKDGFEKPIDYEALTLCMRKINYLFKGKHIGLPQIGSGLAGGDWKRIKQIIIDEFTDCKVTIVIYKP